MFTFACWSLAFVGSIVSLIFAWKFFKLMMSADEGNKEMIDIAQAVREGSDAYLWQQYKIVGVFFVIMFIVFLGMAWLDVQSILVPFAFLTGGFFSGFAGWCGMKTATLASSRTAEGARKSLNQGLQVAFRSGAVMGLSVVGLGLLDIALWFALLYWLSPMILGIEFSLVDITVTMLCFGMGASSQALFARVGGGIFTKAADVGADLVGKVEAGIPEDDKRNPATIADNVGDNVGDVAGMGADLYESYCGSILASAALGVSAFASGTIVAPEFLSKHIGSAAETLKVTAESQAAIALGTKEAINSMQLSALFLPMVLAAVGIGLSIFGIFLVKTEEKADQGTLLKALARGVDASSILIGILALPIAWFMLPGFPLVGFSVAIGLLAGWLIGKWTEYATSDEYKPTQGLADQALTGPATIIIIGIANGMKSVCVPVVVVSIATLAAFACASNGNFTDINYFAMGLYGVGIASVGMLSTLGITLATDAYGPIADNAGGNAEMAGLDPEVRQRTDALDSLGNTTAATGKGFAIGSAALTALALMAAYVEEVRVGFERWGPSEMEVVEDEKPGEFYKINQNFIVGVDENLDKEGEQIVDKDGKPQWKYAGYLAMPVDLRHEQVKEDWKNEKTGNGPKLLSVITKKEAHQLAIADPKPEAPAEESEAATPAPILYTTADGDVGFVGSLGTLSEVHSATMIEWMDFYACNPMNPKVLVGMFLGAMATFVFCAMTMEAVGRAAFGMVEEVRRQFREKPGIMDYTELPDYKTPVAISTQAAQREMIAPSLLGLLTPVVVGLLLGVAGVMGLLVGTLVCGFCLAVFMSNSGGSWDNAKKYIEAGAHGGKGTEAHKAAVVGDTVGDPFKDTSGPSLNILIKLMSMVSVVLAGLIVRYSLVAFGIF